MDVSIFIEMQFFLISILLGVVLLFIYDFFRIMRKLIRHSDLLVAFEDLIFWIMASIIIFTMLYKQNNGIIRGFSIMGMVIGMIIYHKLFSDLFVMIVAKLIQYLIRPLGYLYRKIKAINAFFISIFKKIFRKLFKSLKNRYKSVKIKMDSKKLRKSKKKKTRIK